jgi:hypothetical protein
MIEEAFNIPLLQQRHHLNLLLHHHLFQQLQLVYQSLLVATTDLPTQSTLYKFPINLPTIEIVQLFHYQHQIFLPMVA